jgi:hypothetical protein
MKKFLVSGKAYLPTRKGTERTRRFHEVLFALTEDEARNAVYDKYEALHAGAIFLSMTIPAPDHLVITLPTPPFTP